MNHLTIRTVGTQDTQKILDVYKPYISTAITFELEIPSLSEFENRVKSISERYPYIVCELDGEIVGYAYAHEFKERPAYQWDAELSIYLNQQVHTQGLGKQMYLCLIDLVRLQRVHNVYGIVTLPNEKSQRLHESLGFALAGVMHQTGYKNGAWRDVAWYEKNIEPNNDEPLGFLPLNSIGRADIEHVLKKYNAVIQQD